MATTSPKVFTITEEQYQDLAEGYGGICLACGTTQLGDIEPDAEDTRVTRVATGKFTGSSEP